MPLYVPDLLPVGGSSGQALTKNSATDHDVGWSTISGGGGGPEWRAGRVNADGTIAAGTGFTVSKGGTGLYTVTYTGGFTAQGVAAWAIADGWFMGATANSGTGFTGQVRVSTTHATNDSAFSFVAIGGTASNPAFTVVKQAADVTNATTTPANTDLVFSF